MRIGRIFELDAVWRKKAPAVIKRMRDSHLRPHVDAFFEWVDSEYVKVQNERGSLRSALGYAQRQKGALIRFLDDGRLALGLLTIAERMAQGAPEQEAPS